MHKRSMRQTSFELPCNRLLRDMLGKYGAINGYIEMSCQQMNTRVAGLGEKDLRTFLKEESAKYQIQLYDLPAKLFPLCITQSLMVLPWATLDSFYKEFAKEVRMLVREDFKINADDDETKLEAAIRELKAIDCDPKIERYKLNVYYYYNKIRTNFVHNLHDEKSLKAEKNLYKKIDQKEVSAFFPTIMAPSEPNKLTYADFVLFTATIVNIADMLTTSIKDSIDWDLYFKVQYQNLAEKRRLKEKDDDKWKKVRVDIPKVDGHTGASRVNYVSKCIQLIYGVKPSREIIEKNVCPIE